MKKGIIGIMNNPATSMNSHSAGWNFILRDFIDPKADFLTEKDDWNKYDELYINHGINFKPGSYNIIGGIGEEVIQRIQKLNKFPARRVYSVDGFDFEDFLKKRIQNIKSYQNILPWRVPARDKIIVGDSHSVSRWPGADYDIARYDGKTLFGFLKKDSNVRKEIIFDLYDDIILYFGNIDVRFHLARQDKPFIAAERLIDDYMKFASKYKAKITHLLPVEDESRKIPGSGLYKGKKFFGSQKLRQELSDFINEKMLSDYDYEVLTWPDYFKKDGYMNIEVMEPKQSVHIRPKHYPRHVNKDNLLF
jgi:hypothetical protein